MLIYLFSHKYHKFRFQVRLFIAAKIGIPLRLCKFLINFLNFNAKNPAISKHLTRSGHGKAPLFVFVKKE